MNNIAFELKTRLLNNQKVQNEILKTIEFLPKGHINILDRNGRGYYYLTYRDGTKINNDYLGVVGKTDINDTINKLKKRKVFDEQLKELKKEERILKKLIVQAK